MANHLPMRIKALGMTEKHWSRMEYLHQTVTNPNIHIKGTHSYYSDYWDQGFERSVVRYLLGDEFSRDWEPLGRLDKLYIGNFVCIGAESVILMGKQYASYGLDQPLPVHGINKEAYVSRGDTILGDGCWLGMRAMIMHGVTIGEGAVVAAGAVVTKMYHPMRLSAATRLD